jgi:hypothetical protein
MNIARSLAWNCQAMIAIIISHGDLKKVTVLGLVFMSDYQLPPILALWMLGLLLQDFQDSSELSPYRTTHHLKNVLPCSDTTMSTTSFLASKSSPICDVC